MNKLEELVPHIVARFLTWKLPADFHPDAGISFNPIYNEGTPYEGRHEPSGTNLLNAEQAFAMVRHVLSHPAVHALTAENAKQAEEIARLREASHALIKAHGDTQGYDFKGWCLVLGDRVEELEAALKDPRS